MATEQLVIQIDEKGALVVKRNIESVGKSAKETGGALKLLKRALVTLAGAAVIKQFLSLADTFTTIQNKLKLVTNGTENLSAVTAELADISRRTGASFEETAASFSKFALAAKQLGRSQAEILTFTELVNKAVILGGSSSSEAAGGLRQLSQGLASGALRGDELISVLENLPFVADIIARSLQVTRGELRAMGKEGKITAQVVLDAFKQNEEFLNSEFLKTQATVGQGFVAIKNALVLVVGQFSESEGIGQKFAQVLLKTADAILVLGKHTDTLTVAITSLAVTMGTVKFLAWAQAASGATTAVGALTVGIGALKTATAAFVASLGPIGIGLIAAGAAATATTLYFDKLKNIEEEIEAVETRIHQDRLARVQAQVLEIQNRKKNEQSLKDYITALEEEQRVVTLGKRGKAIEDSLAKAALAAQRGLTDVEKKRIVGLFDMTMALKQNKEMLEEIRSPQAEYNEKLATLERIKPQLGVQEHADALHRLNAEYSKLDVVGTFLESLDKENKLLRENATERAVQLKLLELAQSKGVPLTDPEKEQVRAGLSTTQPLREEAELLDRIIGPQRQYQENVRALNALRAQGLITQQQFNQERLKFDAVFNTVDSLRQEAELLGMTGDERQRHAELLQLENALRQQGQELGATDREVVENLIQENQALAVQADLLESIKGPAKEFAAAKEALNILFLSGKIGIEEYNKSLAVLEGTYLQVSVAQQTVFDSISAAFDEGLRSLQDFGRGGALVFNEFAANALDAIGAVLAGLLRIQFQKALGAALGIPGYASGGSFDVGGQGGTDSQLVAFKASPNERVTIETPNQQRANATVQSPPQAAAAPNIKMVNVLDPSLIREAMAAEEGTQVILNTMSTNKTAVQQVIS